ncbi:hypothetical protein GCWU000341_01072 [Oribacterium sp. oral taxon 078 str. F0262]|nr:hypothetical protein GCWU000341_01072 [Oribacterium sp. oral taxon 078 str. F0262]
MSKASIYKAAMASIAGRYGRAALTRAFCCGIMQKSRRESMRDMRDSTYFWSVTMILSGIIVACNDAVSRDAIRGN